MVKRKRKPAHGLYYHSSPPKVLPLIMSNHQIKSKPIKDNQNGGGINNNNNNKEAIVIKPANIRIWIHDKDINKLTKVLWEGHGNRLKTEVSSNNKVKKFLEAVPFIMNVIKDIHVATIDNNIENLTEKVQPPVPSIILSSKDTNGLTPLHKAAGLAHASIVEYLLNECPASATELDGTGKTPLHWAAAVKNNSRSYNLLVQAGADEQAVDYKMKTPLYYKNKPMDIDRSLLIVIPDAPRIPHQRLPIGYEWNMLGGEDDNSIHSNNNNNQNNNNNDKKSHEDVLEEIGRNSTIQAIQNINNNNTIDNKQRVDKNDDGDKDDIERLHGDKSLTVEEEAVLAAIHSSASIDDNRKLYHRNSLFSSTNAPQDASELLSLIDDVDDKDDKANDEEQTNNNLNTKDNNKIMENGNQFKNIDEDKKNKLNDHNHDDDNNNEHYNIINDPDHDQDQDPDDDDVNNAPSPAMEINGIVRGEAVHGAVPLEGANFPSDQDNDDSNDQDHDVQAIIDADDMEQLAALVLNGDGRKLIGMTTNNVEIQAFLDNVPAYMNKIRRVHVAAREGSLRDLQSALDRRKFALAKDEISPFGATPLHVATIFGHAAIVRYLAGRFPETTAATDENGRTPLHYAATISDNGHFYNLLMHLGANPKLNDIFGHSPEFYFNHEQSNGILSHRLLLNNFGASEEFLNEMLSDQDMEHVNSTINTNNNNNNMGNDNNNRTETPLLGTEEGRYLASTLGDPLIKGLTEIANNRPPDPITYLAEYLQTIALEKHMKLKNPINGDGDDDDDGKNNTNNGDVKEIAKNIDTDTTMKAFTNQETLENLDESTLSQSPAEDDTDSIAPNDDERDEHGQSMLHFACARSHGRNALVQLIEESGVSITYRDELYRTARDVSLQASQGENAREIDRYVLSLAARGDLDTFQQMLMDGYDHIIDITNKDDISAIDIAKSRGHTKLLELFEGAREFEETRERLHKAIREGEFDLIRNLIGQNDMGSKLVRAKNYFGRCSIHIAILKENEEIVEFIASNYRNVLKIGDNLERTPLHYAMGVANVESLSRILIKHGAKRIVKDLKGRQPSYYFMNKADILRLQEEEEDDEDE